MWIFVQTLTGETIPLEVQGSDAMNVIKAKIQNCHRLIYNGKLLDDMHCLGHYEIHSGCSLILDLNRGGTPMTIFIQMMADRTITLDVQSTDTISTVKAMIHHMYGIPVDQQCLTFDGKQLKNGCSLADYNIGRESTVCLALMNVQIFVENPSGGKALALEAALSETIYDVTQKVKRRIQLILDEEPLEYSRTLADYNIQNQPTLHLDLHFQDGAPMPIFIQRVSSGERIRVEVLSSDSIQDVKEKIQDELGILPKNQLITYRGRQLKDSYTLADYHVEKESVLELEDSLGRGMHIFVKTLDGEISMPLNVDTFDTIYVIKAKIQDQQRLMISEKRLEDNRSLSDYNIKNRSTLQLKLRSSGSFLIFVKDLKGHTLAFEVESSDKVADIKEKIHYLQHIPPGKQRLVYGLRRLEDNRTLAENNISKESTLHLLLRLGVGGGQ